MTVRIAHGYGNNRAALERALAADVDVIELDVWYRGGRMFVRHETRLGVLPIVGDRPKPPHTRRRFLKIGRYYFRPDIWKLRLEEVLEAVDGRKGLLLDTKGTYRAEEAAGFAEALAQAVRARGEDGIAVCGQNHDVLDCFRRAAPDIELRYSVERPDQWQRFAALAAREERVRRMCVQHRFLDEEKRSFIRQKGVHTYCWTVDDAATASRLVADGVDGIISNDLSLLAAL